MTEPLRAPIQVEYPESDGEPMAEDDLHRVEMSEYAIEVLEDFFATDANVYVSGNNFIYFTEGDPSDSVSPDTYVVIGVPKHRRKTFKVWEEKAVPCFVLEITSQKTARKDRGDKRAIYEGLGVGEYVLFDPTTDWIREGLRAFRLEGGSYVPVIPQAGGLESRGLGLTLFMEGGHLRFRDSTGRILPTRAERAEQERARAEREKARAEQEKARADAAESKVLALRAELEKLRGSR
ncbi:MAG: Uma2 family endonuclease [Deltaproteobacteria bacterium]|nr:Uma2 family endonuclease [Deltaproteobacteria bacterium]